MMNASDPKDEEHADDIVEVVSYEAPMPSDARIPALAQAAQAVRPASPVVP